MRTIRALGVLAVNGVLALVGFGAFGLVMAYLLVARRIKAWWQWLRVIWANDVDYD